jgi:unsaturated rhamnogalacturonyl hydrolase
MGKLTGESKYFDDASKQIFQFSQRMFNEDKGVYMHGWIQDMNPHPEFYWARCNGWALLAMTELLDVLPSGYPLKKDILGQFRLHIKGLASYQSGTGFWHQLLDRNDSYPETSATAIFTYCIAHGINMGWLDAQAYGPAAVLGWNATQTKVNDQGQVEGTCVGTGMAFDPAFYYHRPVNVAAAHGYGPVILAGVEMLKLIKNYQIVINDSAVMFYRLGTDWSNNR